MPNNHETTTDDRKEIQDAIATFGELLDIVDSQEKAVTPHNKIHEAEAEAFVKAYDDWEAAKNRFGEENLNHEFIADVIGKIKTKMAIEMNEQNLAELNSGLALLEEAQSRIGLESNYEAIVENYGRVAYGEPSLSDTAADTDVELARRDFMVAIDQLKNDTEAMKLLYTYQVDSTKIRYSHER